MNRHNEWILILDYGSQFTQLIARRLREFNIYCEIHPYNVELSTVSKPTILRFREVLKKLRNENLDVRISSLIKMMAY